MTTETMIFMCRLLGHKWSYKWILPRDGHGDKYMIKTCKRCGVTETTKPEEPEPEEDMDFLFERLTAERLARHIIGDVRVQPSPEQIANAQSIIDRTGALYRLRAGFRAREWVKKEPT